MPIVLNIPAKRIVSYANQPVDFDFPPTVLGQPMGPAPYTAPTLTATSPSSIISSSPGVTFSNIAYTVDGNKMVTLTFNAQCTTTANTGNIYASFVVAPPNVAASFTDQTALTQIVTGIDFNGTPLPLPFANAVTGGKTVQLNLFPNAAGAQQLDVYLKYQGQ